MKARNWDVASGENLKREMTAAGLTVEALAEILGVNPKTIKNWRRGLHGPSDDQKQSIKQLLLLRSEFRSKAHPHQFLFSRLRQAASARIKYEVVGLPGMLKSNVLRELSSNLGVDGQQVLLVESRNEIDIEGFWNSLGQSLINAPDKRFKFEDVEQAVATSKLTLLLDDADYFLRNVQDACINSGCEFSRVGSQWIKQVQSLRCAVIMTSTIPTADFVGVTSGKPSPYSITELELKSWYRKIEWNSWTTAIVDGEPLLAVERIKEDSEGIPLVFVESITALKAHGVDAVRDTIRELHSHIANSIWNRLPAGRGKELIDYLNGGAETRLTRALSKSGILVAHGNSLRLRVKDWLTTWKREAEITS